MGEIVDRVRSFALLLGAPGLFLVSFLDSSFLPLPGITDVLLVVMVTRNPGAMLWYVVMTVVGSVAGCLVLHYVGRKGGEALVRKRFTGERVEWAMGALRNNGVMAMLIPSLLPPPSPFKLFVLLAGVVGISIPRFATAIAIGRGVRYLALGYLSVKYGERATTYMRENGTSVSIAAAAILAAGFGIFMLWRRRGHGGQKADRIKGSP
jgi:membrane protein YqaA with SNARE-associated domain